MATLYTATATASGGRDGSARSDDGVLDVALSTPKSLGGAGKAGATNPEQLFAAGYAACFDSALRFVARSQGVTITESAVTARVGIGPNGQGGFGLEAALDVSLPGLDRDAAEKLVATAHQVCPYSNATRGNIEVTLTVI
ncbi:organic hydroperoxide resistance protein [Caulobacter mirabilis]|uniref:Organic hydroperoxide resistance protein n=1 Tax=Caulobacter mirabilis TaxID=69666 RepID=A0A2D2B163_9CAUL|nr:organic hydroperoxide resistance protein [Caulobacter mirabilis]ATQ43969.1 organic hydroperoxide resistance protein [Caulobacter mirabilis]